MMRNSQTLTLAVAGLALAACGNQNPTTQKLNDAQLVAVLDSLDQSEVNTSQTVAPSLKDDATQRFARQVIEQYTQSQAAIAEVADQQGIVAQPGALSEAIDKNASAVSGQFSDPEAVQLDIGYADDQVTMQQEILTLIDCAVLPNLKNSALKSQVTDQFRPMVATDLGDVESIALALRHASTNVADAGTSDGGSVLEPIGEGATSSDGVDCSNVCTRSIEGGPLQEEFRQALCK